MVPLEHAACYLAVTSRDARFDGRFFTGVMTTGIYCRPTCPARIPLPQNCRFFPSAAAASGAGLRPCRRCRPETAPGTPAWSGTSATVGRALKLIDAGALARESEAALANRLGIGERHLRRLFVLHVGAAPREVERTRRAHLAAQLLETTTLPLGAVAEAAGFSSLRRFNDVMRAAWASRPRLSAAAGDGERRPPPAGP